MLKSTHPSDSSRTFALGQSVRLIMATLSSAGLRDVVISPGSRSTPLAREALLTDGLKCHSVIDERAAGFFALGMARTTGRPTLLICTSGSAGAHYLPSAIEARHAGVPLLLMTADRPSELKGCGAPQTINQIGLFGSFAPTIALFEPSVEADKLRSLSRKIRQAYAQSVGPEPGPVHVNVPMGKPLEATPPASPEEEKLAALTESIFTESASLPAPQLTVSADVAESLIAQLSELRGEVLLCAGPVEPEVAEGIRQLASQWQVPCAIEFPQAGRAFPVEFLARAWSEGSVPHPAAVLHFGPPCVSSAWNAALKAHPRHLFIAPGVSYLDPSHRGQVLLGDCVALLDRLLKRSIRAPAKPEFAQAYAAFEAIHRNLLARAVEELAPSPLSEVGATLGLLKGATAARQLLLGNSMPIRLATWLAPLAENLTARIQTARGANGIDGWVAAATGAATAAGEPTLVFLGDVTAAHDVGSFQLATSVRSPLLFALLDNRGGRIFEHLPARKLLSDDDFSFWATPPTIDWKSAAGAFQLRYETANSLGQVENLTQELLQHRGPSLLHIRATSETTAQFLAQMRAPR